MQNNEFEYKHPSTIWEIIKSKYEIEIINGSLGTGEKMPSISTISERFSVTRNTAVKVLDSMRKDNLIYKKQGTGYFIKPMAREKLFVSYEKKALRELEQAINTAKLVNMTIPQLESHIMNLWNEE